ncbi:MAG: DUF4159 domain-containing protein [Gemmatimonadota bacterium]
MRPPLASNPAFVALALTVSTAAAAAAYSYAGAAASAEVAESAAPTQPTQFGPRSQRASSARPGERPSHNFYFTRAVYTSWGGGFGWGRWATDFPQADRWIVNVLGRLTGVDVSPLENPVRLDDPDLRRYPFLYALEVGDMALRDREIEGLRNYLLAGGFLVIDDFWGAYEWDNFEREFRKVLPEYEIVDLPLDHPIFSTFYQIEQIIQVPNVGQGIRGGPTHERGETGRIPRVRGIFDEDGRLMVIINWNTDLGDAWEWAEDPQYPLQYSTFAYQMAANFIVYAMTR